MMAKRAAERHPEFQPQSAPAIVSVAEALVGQLAELDVESAFGVSGGAIAQLYDALAESPIALHHFRHETGAAFAATEAHFASDRPTAVFTTAGPGLLNALNGLTAARWDGAKVVLVSGATSPAQRGRWATQESSSYTLPQDALYGAGPLFDYAIRVESAAELPEVFRRLELGFSRPGGFVAHVALPIGLQSHRLQFQHHQGTTRISPPAVPAREIERCARLLEGGPFAVWVGFGARKAAPQIRRLLERTGTMCFSSPRGKGIVSENHPQFLGVSGLGGHDAVAEYMVQHQPDRVLVLGTRMGEATSFWDNDLLPTEGFIHVDLDPEVPGTAFPQCPTLGIQAEIGEFLDTLLAALESDDVDRPKVLPLPILRQGELARRAGESQLHPGRPVRPQALMEALQSRVVQGSDAVVMSECGNAFAWCNHYLRFSAPERYRVSPHWGSMGHCAAGVVGAALARRGKAVAVVGDGSMLMGSEISTAAQYRAQAVWVVLNDAGYGMCRKGQETLGLTTEETEFPAVDFVAFARSMGADGTCVRSEDELDAALDQAMEASGPFVVDVVIDPEEPSPLLQRFESLIGQGSTKNVAGWER